MQTEFQKPLHEFLSRDPFWKKLCSTIARRKKLMVGPLPGSAREFLLIKLFMDSGLPMLVVVREEGNIDRIGQNLKAYASLLGAEGEIVPFLHCGYGTDRFDKMLFNDKIRTFKNIRRNRPFIAVATERGIKEQVPYYEENSLRIRVKQTLKREELIRALYDKGYERVNYVECPGEYAVRGGIIDFFGPGNAFPARLELNGDEVDCLKSFDPATQRTIKDIFEEEIFSIRAGVQSMKNLFEEYPSEFRIYYYEEDSYIECGDELHDYILFSAFEPLSGGTEAYSPLKVDLQSWGQISKPLTGRLEGFLEWLGLERQKYPRLFISGGTEGELHRLKALVSDKYPDFVYETLLSPLQEGFIEPSQGFALFTDAEIFSRYQTRSLGFKHSRGFFAKPQREFHSGDYVVHFSHGVGIYRETTHMEIEGKEEEVMVVEYAEEARLFVPKDHYYLMEKYVGTSSTSSPSLDHLGSSRWQKKKEDAVRDIADYAVKILKVEAEREMKEGESYSTELPDIHDFENSFRFQETPDQEKAIRDVKKDLESIRPMNRLILGDAGYGKTEVAARAAFICVMAGRQAALMAPTTLLAEQHYRTFTERMADYPLRVEVLSRFTSAAEQRKIITDLKSGKVDVVIGTHRLVQKDVQFKELGLLIIDEEQKFGVAHKDFLIRQNPLVNILFLSATPIPRTLYLSLMGARNMSAIMTPPIERRPVETIVIKEDWRMVKKAVESELARNGQVFVVHNRIESIHRIADKIRDLVPKAITAVAHGRLDEEELKSIMNEFVENRIHCLIATNIIESGLDLPNVNTLIVHEADKFGLAELYQLRGRIGRFNRKAYAYFMLTPGRVLDSSIQRKVQAIKEFSKPGGGYNVALKDLEIRGAGNILGIEQSGHIAAIGFDLYCKLLRDAVQTLKGEPITPRYEVALYLGDPGFLPESYMPEFEDRFFYYKKLAIAEGVSAIEEIRGDVRDQFGRMPPSVETLFDSFILKCHCRKRRIAKIELYRNTLEILELNKKTKHFRVEGLKTSLLEYVTDLVLKEYPKK